MRVTRQVVAGFRYTVSYRKSDGTHTINFAVIVDVSGKIKLDSYTSADDTVQPLTPIIPPIPPTPPAPIGGVEVLAPL